MAVERVLTCLWASFGFKGLFCCLKTCQLCFLVRNMLCSACNTDSVTIISLHCSALLWFLFRKIANLHSKKTWNGNISLIVKLANGHLQSSGLHRERSTAAFFSLLWELCGIKLYTCASVGEAIGSCNINIKSHRDYGKVRTLVFMSCF